MPHAALCSMRDYGGDWRQFSKRQKGMGSPDAYVDDCMTATPPFQLGSGVLLDCPPASWWLIILRGVRYRYMMWLGVNCRDGAATDIKAQVPTVWAKGYMFDNCAFPVGVDMAIPYSLMSGE